MKKTTTSKQKCNSGTCSNSNITKSIQNGKGDKPRPFSKQKYNKNYESINWKRN